MLEEQVLLLQEIFHMQKELERLEVVWDRMLKMTIRPLQDLHHTLKVLAFMIKLSWILDQKVFIVYQ